MRFIFIVSLIMITCKVHSQPCDLTVGTPSAIHICNPGNVPLNGFISGRYDQFTWKSDLGYSNSSNLNPAPFINQTETFTLCASGVSDVNLVNNGDFEGGFSGFFSSYNYNSGTGLGGLAQGSFNLDVVTPFLWTGCGGISGTMMVVNAATVTGVNVYCTDVVVDPGCDYVISADVMNINNPPPILQFSINGGLLGSPIVGAAPCAPVQFSGAWNSGSATSATICVVNQNTAASGNDFAMDNIIFNKVCKDEMTFTISVTDFDIIIPDPGPITCEDQNLNLYGAISQGTSNFYDYFWQTNDGNILSNPNNFEILIDQGGLYELTVIDDNTCSRQLSIQIDEDLTLPMIDLDPYDSLSCTVDSVLINVNTNPNYLLEWEDGSGTIVNLDNFYVQEPGMYTITVTNNDNKCLDSISFEIEIDTMINPIDLQGSNILDCTNLEATLSIDSDSLITDYSWVGPDVTNALDDTLMTNSAGMYQLVVTFENGCTDEAMFDLEEHVPDFSFDVMSDPIINCTTDSSIIELDIFSDNIALEWIFENDSISNQNQITVLSTGWYIYELRDSVDCLFIDSIFVGEDFVEPAFISYTDSLSCTVTQGEIGVILDNPNDQVDWVGPNNSIYSGSDIIIDAIGTYNVIVTGANGCTSQSTVEVASLSLTTQFTIVGMDTLNCTTQFSDLIASSTLAITQPYWVNPLNEITQGEQVTATIAGIYSFYGTTADGCEQSTEYEIIIDTISPDLNIIPPSLLDCNVSSLMAQFNSDTDLTGVSWELDGNFYSNEDSINIDQAGNYELIITGENGCTNSEIFTVEIDTVSPDFTIVFDSINCSNQLSTIAIIDPLNQNYTIENLQDGSSVQNTELISSTAGDFEVVMIGDNGCETIKRVSITIDTISPTVLTTQSTITCDNPNALIEIIDPQLSVEYSFYENNILIGAGNSLMWPFSGEIAIEAVADNGCSSTELVTIDIDTISPSFEVTFDSITCMNMISNISIDDPLNQEFEITQLSTGDVFTNQNFTTQDGGEYIITVIGDNGCSSFKSIDIPVDTITPELLVSSTTITCDSPMSFVEVLNPNNLYDYYFYFNGTQIGTGTNLTWANGDQINIEVVDRNGCSRMISHQILMDTLSPMLDVFSSVITCENTESILEILSPDNQIDYNFYSGPDLIGSGNSVTLTSADFISIEAIASNGCSTSISHQILIDTTSLDFSLMTDTLTCNNTSVFITANPNLQGQELEWQFNGSFYSNDQELDVTEGGVYSLTVVNSTNGCPSQREIEVIEWSNVPTAFNFDLINPPCDETIFFLENLDIIGGEPDFEVSINNGSFEAFNGQSFEFNEGLNDMVIRDKFGCTLDTSFVLTLFEAVAIELISEIELIIDTDYTLDLFINKPLSEIASIQWSPSINLSCDDCLNPIVNLNEPQVIEVLVIDINGCEARAQISLKVPDREFQVYIPNVFSPHKLDGINDIFKLFAKIEDINKVLKLEIYDRWGNQLFTQYELDLDDPTLGWNGRFQNQKLDPAVFVYLIEVEFVDRSTQIFGGDVTLID